MSNKSDKPRKKGPAAQRLLPIALWELPLTKLRLEEDLTARLNEHDLWTVGDILKLPVKEFAKKGRLPDADREAFSDALERVLADGLRQFGSSTTEDWPTLRAQLLGPLDEPARRILVAAVGIDDPPLARQALVQLLGSAQLDESLDHVRSTLLHHNTSLLQRMQDEVEGEFAAFDGILMPMHAAAGSLVSILSAEGDDPTLGLRLIAFCLPHRCHLHRGVLHGVPARRFRELLRTLPQLVPQHRLPLPIDTISKQLNERGIDVPRGTLLHVLRTEMRTGIELDGKLGEVAVPDPRTPSARLAEILEELREPTSLTDLVFAYRERFRFASQQHLLRHLSRSSAFLRIGDATWALRHWCEQDLDDCAALTEHVVRRICSESHRQNVLELVREEWLLANPELDGEGGIDEYEPRTAWLVLDRLVDDVRVRLLGRGEACAADQTQSSVMRRLQRGFRRAAGEVVKGLFIQNQAEHQRRLVLRLLNHNRAFVQPDEDRIDTLSNYPFNAERMQRLIKMVLEHLQKRTGYAQAEALCDAVNETDLGGDWLSADLLSDILRRNGPFELLAPGIVALKDLALPSILMRSARQALRSAREAVTIDDVVRARPDLAEFTDCLAELLMDDPLVQSPDGKYFVLQ